MLAGRVPFTGESATIIMMKQVQDAPPSILATRPDLPPAVDRVIAQALAKRPGDRFHTAGELCAALSTAVSEAVSTAPRAAETIAGAPVSLATEDPDEETVVRPRREAPLRTPVAAGVEPIASFNLRRIMIPSAIVLVVVFGVVFLLTRSAGQPQPKPTQGQPELAADPNSQPVQASSPPTGAGERDIRSVPDASPAASASANANQRQSAPDVLGDYAANSNVNDNASGSGRNSNQPGSSPTPKAKASPSVENKSEPQPPPKPSPNTRTVAKPSATTPGELR